MNTDTFVLKNEPQSKLGIITQGFQFYKNSYPSWLPYSLLAMVFIFFLPDVIGMSAPIMPLRWQTPSPFIGFSFLYLIGWLVVMSALTFRLYCISYQIPEGFIDSFKNVFLKIISLIMVAAVYSLIVLAGTSLLVIPGIILTFSLMFSFILIIIENQNVFQTLMMSHRLVWGHWWHTFLVITFVLLLNMSIFMLFLWLLLSIKNSFHLTYDNIYNISFIFNMLLQAFFIPFLIYTALILHHDLRMRLLISQPHW